MAPNQQNFVSEPSKTHTHHLLLSHYRCLAGQGRCIRLNVTIAVIIKLWNGTIYSICLANCPGLVSLCLHWLVVSGYRGQVSLQWRHNGSDSVSNHQPRECLLSRLIMRRSKKTSKLRVTGLCAGNSPETGEFPAQRPVTRKMFPFDDVIMC